MGIAKVIGVILLLGSTLAGITLSFVFLNSSAYLDYNTGENMGLVERLSVNGLMIPLIFCAVFFIIGFFLSKDRILNDTDPLISLNADANSN